ncbi:photosystem II protein D2 [Iris pallida]|uniref:Photosystem II protein D2 (Plastid) n=1 Tax=Iris pallida TaxID=29817 RepID=A0AAX6FLV8_IRIPA|nr:photosystem II protein D2 [Iris pallida]
MKWVQHPIMKPLKEEDKSKYSCYTKTGTKNQPD